MINPDKLTRLRSYVQEMRGMIGEGHGAWLEINLSCAIDAVGRCVDVLERMQRLQPALPPAPPPVTIDIEPDGIVGVLTRIERVATELGRQVAAREISRMAAETDAMFMQPRVTIAQEEDGAHD